MNFNSFNIAKILEETNPQEGRGLVARTSEDIFTNDKGRTLRFDRTVLFPDPSTSSEPIEDLASLKSMIDEYVEANKINLVKEFGAQNAATKAAILAVLKNKKGIQYGWVRFFQTIGRHEGRGKWTDSQFYRDTGFMRREAKVVESEMMPIKPADLVDAGVLYTIPELIEKVSASITDKINDSTITVDVGNDIIAILQSIAHGTPNPVLYGQATNASTFHKYVSELLAPVALVTGHLVTGPRDKIETDMLFGESLSSCSIGYPGASEALYDSYIVSPNGTKIKISSKAKRSGGSGAASSLSSVSAKLEEIMLTDPEKYAVLQRKYGRIFAILTTFEKESAINGVLNAAILAGLIKDADRDFILGLISNNISLTTYQTHYKTPERLERVANGQGDISPTKIVNIASVNPAYKPGYHLLAIVAKALGNIINSNDLFNSAIKELLAADSFIQIVNTVKVLGENLMFDTFKVVHLEEEHNKIVAWPGKYFYSTGTPKGKFPFKIT